MTLYTIFIFFVSFYIKLKLKVPYLNNNIVILLGFTYFFPLRDLYEESSDRTLAIMLFSWIHTMTVTFLSVQISRLTGFDNYFVFALIIQTIIYSFTTPFVIKFVKNKFIYILKNIPYKMNKYLIILSLVEFFTILIINLYFPDNINVKGKMVVALLVAFSAALSYHLIYIIVKNSKNIKYLKQLAYTDTLTGVKNRFSFFYDCERLISENRPFTLIYMDLDDFKKVNDTYGHSAGDNYLKQFIKAIVKIVSNNGSIYRMSGDEFVCVYNKEKTNTFFSTFGEKIEKLFEMSIPFLGVSIGYTKYPEDADSLDDLINRADDIMYRVKKSNKTENFCV
jgi:diguanylate cyclase (GGDEF)-like protein